MNAADIHRLASGLGATRVVDVGVRVGGSPLDWLAFRDEVRRVIDTVSGVAADEDNISPSG